jgi:hypothetical protein
VDFNYVDELVTDTVNSMLCNSEAKKMHQENLLGMVALACIQYENNKKFKREINNYIEFRKMTIELGR